MRCSLSAVQRCPLLDLSAIKPTKELLMEYYHGKITDESTTLSCFTSNPGAYLQ